MKVLILGSGGREHSLALKIAKSPLNPTLYIAPGNAGTAGIGTNVAISETDHNAILNFAKTNAIDLTVVGPEAPLALGIVDLFEKHNLAIIGPCKKAAKLESSKAWAKAIMKKYNIPTAGYDVFTELNVAKQYIEKKDKYPIVIKADGLAAGKGVTIAHTQQDALTALENCFTHHQFGNAGDTVVIEDFLEGEEASIFAITDGTTTLLTQSCQDHKAIYDGDKGPNTGGMGAYSPAPIVSKSVEKKITDTILSPLIQGLKNEGIPYSGFLFIGLMIHNNIPTVVEFNVRLGDPETQVLLPRLKNDLLALLIATTKKELHHHTLEWHPNAAIGIVAASGGYPGPYEKNKPISGLQDIAKLSDTHVIHAGTQIKENIPHTNGGRVLCVISTKPTLKEAQTTAYKAITKIHFEKMIFRTDIGNKGLPKN